MKRFSVEVESKGEPLRVDVEAADEAEARLKARNVADRIFRGADSRGVIKRDHTAFELKQR